MTEPCRLRMALFAFARLAFCGSIDMPGPLKYLKIMYQLFWEKVNQFGYFKGPGTCYGS